MNDFESPTIDSVIGRRFFVVFGVLILAALSIFQDAAVTGRLMLRQTKRYLSEEHDAITSNSIYTAVVSSVARLNTNKEEDKASGSAAMSTLCDANPYAPSINKTLAEMAKDADKWLESLPEHLKKANSTRMRRRNHDRYFPMNPMATCNHTCVGGACGDDESKIACGIDTLKEGCVVYSIGGNNQWQFELDLLETTPCEVHTFDCTGNITRFEKPESDRLFFHHICLGEKHAPPTETCPDFRDPCGETMTIEGLQKRFGHKRIDLLKMDIEGSEWNIFESWPTLPNKTAQDMVLPYQILVEMHFRKLFPWGRRDFRFPEDVVMLQKHLLQMGYATVVRDDNRWCRHCTEFTFVRFKCPSRLEPNVLS